MPPGRNDPCPCGSGKKYKHCCARYDAAASPLLRAVGKGTRSELETVAQVAIRVSAPWEADVTPMPVVSDSDPSARHAAVMLAANGAMLHIEFEAHPPSDASGIATLLANAMDAVLAGGGLPPSEVIVRHAAVAAELRRMLGEATPVAHAPRLPMLDEFSAAVRQQITGLPLPASSQPQMWAAWDLPAETLRRLFSAAAAFYVAAPWLVIDDATPLELTMPNGAVWNAITIGFEGHEIGLILHESLEDYIAMIDAPDPDVSFDMAQATVISLSFDVRADLPKPMRREFTDNKWMVAGPSAYPSLWALNTIGGGLSSSQADDLAMALEIIARIGELSGENHEVLEALGTSWTDETSGSIVRYAPYDDRYLWDIPQMLEPSLAQGSRADSTAHFGFSPDNVTEDAAIVARFAAAMRASGAEPERATHDEQDADFFVQLMHGEQGVRLPAVTELDLRTFLYDLLPRKSMTTKEHGNAIRASLERFFDYLAASEELCYPWATAILRDDPAFEERWESCPGRQRNDALGAWMAELYEDLDARVMLPANQLAGVGEWGETMGVEESQLYTTLGREWLRWRDAEIALGNRTPKELWDRLTARQAEWEQTPQARLGDRPPSEVIVRERGPSRRAKPRARRR
jgi:hypothetical protein